MMSILLAASRGKSNRLAWFVIIIGILLGLYALQYLDVEWSGVPLPGRITSRQNDLQRLYSDLEHQRQLAAKRAEQLSDLNRLADNFYRAEERMPTTEIQSQVEGMALRSGFRYTRLGAPSVNELGDYLHTVDITLSGKVNIKAFADLVRAVENHRPMLTWQSCSVRVDNPREPRDIMVNAQIRAYVLNQEVVEHLSTGGTPTL